MVEQNDIKRLSYLLQILGHNKSNSDASFESLCHPNIAQHLQKMVSKSPLVEDLYLSETTASQFEVETSIREIYADLLAGTDGVFTQDAPLDIESHLSYVEHHLQNPLPGAYFPYDSNHAWMVYWLVNSKTILDGKLTDETTVKGVSSKVASLVIDNGYGGIAGGPFGQVGHVASTYAAILSLVLVKDYDLMEKIKGGLHHWFLSLKHANGAFSMHLGGECDTRSTYCVLAVADLLGVMTADLVKGTQKWILSCQTYEGGFAGVPNAEAHGGYTFCAVASLVLLKGLSSVNLEPLIAWLAARQLSLEGGFCGRTNKLVDACYSFWIGACFCMVEAFTNVQDLFDRGGLKSYILNCCQAPEGGLRDKPGKRQDFYHTNYTLCGLSLAEHTYKSDPSGGYRYQTNEAVDGATYTIPVDPVFGLPCNSVESCYKHLH